MDAIRIVCNMIWATGTRGHVKVLCLTQSIPFIIKKGKIKKWVNRTSMFIFNNQISSLTCNGIYWEGNFYAKSSVMGWKILYMEKEVFICKLAMKQEQSIYTRVTGHFMVTSLGRKSLVYKQHILVQRSGFCYILLRLFE